MGLRTFLPLFASALLGSAACGGDDSSASNAGGSGGSGGTTTTTTTTSAGGSGGAGGTDMTPPPSEDWTRDIVSTDLALDLAALTGKATIVLAPSSTSTGASFEIGDLVVSAVSDASGPLQFAAHPPQLDVGVPASADPASLVVEYAFSSHTNFDGYDAGAHLSFLWPYFCGNLFPCKSDPSDGLTFTMSVTGVPGGLTAVYPTAIAADAPSYMPAVAVDAFTKIDLGTTPAGTKIAVWHLPGQEADAATGTAHLVAAFDFYEKTYGAYPFGGEAGSVSVDWGGGDYGGMEHHPFWHVSSGSLSSEEVNAHEAAHGWFGDGVRIACWEDFVLSEGTVSYMAAHALETLGVDIWPDYACELAYYCDPANGANTIALPSTCGAIDLLNDPLWSGVPYMKGAYFYKAVADQIGAAALDEALADFYATHVGGAAHMSDLVETIKAKTDAAGAAAIDDLRTVWLETEACPIDWTTLCP